MITPLRAVAFAAWFYGVTFTYSAAGIWVRLFAPRLALPLAQRWARRVMSGLEPLAGIRVVVTGLHHLPLQGAALLASQHQSAFDTIVWMALLPRPCYVMKQELLRIPLFGPLLVPAGMIPVDRDAQGTALRGLLRAAGRAAENDRQIVIFPEGTRTVPGQCVRLHPGVVAIAKRTALPVLPVATDSGLCWPRSLLRKRPGLIHVAIGPPLTGAKSREDIMARLQAFWHETHRNGFKVVDKSVETAIASRSVEAARRL